MAKALGEDISLFFSVLLIRLRIFSSVAKMLATCMPARLNALLGEVQVTEWCMCCSESEAKGVYRCAGLISSQCISSAMIVTLLRRQISPRRLSSCRVHTLPTGLCGLHRRNSFTFGSAAFFSKSSKLIR